MAIVSFFISNNCLKILVITLFIIYHLLNVSLGQFRVGFYSEVCPDAESVIRSIVQEAIHNNPRNAAMLLRLHFHDCFVEGCDGSILIDGQNAEKGAKGHEGLGGFDVIERAKTELESKCGGVVSCADIVALAARDSVLMTNGPFYDVPTGRRDGLISSVSLAADMPEVDESIDVQKSKFSQKGLNARDLVLLSGAHTIGTTACFFMKTRLYNFTKGVGFDPALDNKFVETLRRNCPFGGDINIRIPLDPSTENIFDNQILHNIKNGFAVIASDARLMDSNDTRQILESYITNLATGQQFFFQDFAKAMVKMGLIGIKTGSQGEIRRVCRSFN